MCSVVTMRTIAFILLVHYLVTVVGVSSTAEIVERERFFGYELIVHRLENLEDKIADSFDRLVEIVSKNQNTTEEKFIELKANVDANNSTKILDYQLFPLRKPCQVPSISEVDQTRFPKYKVYCKVDFFDGGWLVIQQRVDNTLNFNRSWTEYRDGFGTVGQDSDFWLGLEAVHQFTKGRLCGLLVEMRDMSGDYKFARYSRFGVAAEDDQYKLLVEGHSGTAGNKLNYHNNMKFTTFDGDNDHRPSLNCAQMFGGGGWWFGNCYECNLNRASGAMWSESVDDKEKLSYSRMIVNCE